MGISYSAKYHPAVKDDLSKIDKKTKNRIKKAIDDKLLTHPELFGIPLRQSLKGHRKLRVGIYRIVFSIQGRTVYITAILPRDSVYRFATMRT